MFVILMGGALAERGPLAVKTGVDSVEEGRMKCWKGKWGLWLFVRR